jgi:hypothetical protein
MGCVGAQKKPREEQIKSGSPLTNAAAMISKLRTLPGSASAGKFVRRCSPEPVPVLGSVRGAVAEGPQMRWRFGPKAGGLRTKVLVVVVSEVQVQGIPAGAVLALKIRPMTSHAPQRRRGFLIPGGAGGRLGQPSEKDANAHRRSVPCSHLRNYPALFDRAVERAAFFGSR